MKIKYIYTIIILLASIASFSQQTTYPAEDCGDVDMTTNPTSPVDLRGQPYLNQIAGTTVPKFDWRTDLYEWFKPNKPQPFYNLESPFYTFNNSTNIDNLIDNDQLAPDLRDNKVEEGWEVVSYEFGKNYFGVVLPGGPDHPLLVLYNKYKGILRVFVYFRETNFEEDYDVVSIKLLFSSELGGQFESANLNHFDEVPKPIDKYDKYQNEQVANEVSTGQAETESSGQWLFADFVMAYDPCVCNFRYKPFEIRIKAINKATVTLTGDLDTDPINKPSATSQGTADAISKYKTGFKESTDALKSAKTSFESTKAYRDFVLSMTNSTSAVPGGSAGKIPKAKREEIAKTLKILQGVPYLGMAVGVANYFLFKEDKPGQANTPPITFNATVSLTGGIEEFADLDPKLLYVPGSDFPTTNIANVPLYNKPLGVFSLLNTPVIEFKRVIAGTLDVNGILQPHPKSENLPLVTSFSLKEPLRLALNPSSELQFVEVKVSTVLEYAPPSSLKSFQNVLSPIGIAANWMNYPYIPGVSLGIGFLNPGLSGVGNWDDVEWDLANNSDVNLELQDKDKYYKVSYGQMPLGCYKNASFNLISNIRRGQDGDQTLVYEKPKLTIRVNALLEHATTKEKYLIIQSYAVSEDRIVEIVPPNGQYDMYAISTATHPEAGALDFSFTLLPTIGTNNSSGNIYKNALNKPDFLIFEDETIGPGVIEAWDGIIIKSLVNIMPGTELIAGSSIQMQAENKHLPEVKMRIGRSMDLQTCSSLPITDFVVTDYGTFCDYAGPPTYSPYAPKRDLNGDNTEEVSKLLDFNLYPNPTKNLVNIQLEVEADQNYFVEFLDIQGKQIMQQNVSSGQFSNGSYTMDVSGISGGLYFVKVSTDDHVMTKRLIIEK